MDKAIAQDLAKLLGENNKKIEDLGKELRAAKRLLWATIYVNGKEVRIPDSVFISMDQNQELECSYDKMKRLTILRSKISIPEFIPSASVPDKP